MMAGALVYVMGPSGAGKDSLMEKARQLFADDPGFIFVTRYITRKTGAVGEEFHAVNENDFAALEEAGKFLFNWRSHGLRYGIPRDILSSVAEGKVVVVNGSRVYLNEALNRFPALVPLMVSARPEILAARLAARGRETAAEQIERLHSFKTDGSDLNGVKVIDNSGDLDRAALEFADFLKRAASRSGEKRG